MNIYKKSLLLTGSYLLACQLCYAEPPPPLLYYDFDESSIRTEYIVRDSSGNNLHAVLAETDTHTSPVQAIGYQGSGLYFNGNSLLKIGDHSLLDLNQYTAMAWIKYQDFSGNDGRQEIYEKVHSYWMNILKGSGRLRVGGIFGSCNDANRKWIYVDSLSAIEKHAWTHVAASYNGSTLNVYINGQLDAQTPVSGTVCDSDQPLTLGAKHHLATFDTQGRVLEKPVAFMKGTIDEFRLFSAVLSQPQIEQIMNQETGLAFAATIIEPLKRSTNMAPVSIFGTATSPAGVSQVVVGIKDNLTKKWWGNGSWGTWLLAPSVISSANATQTRVNWEFPFDPRASSGSGNYLLIVRVEDPSGTRSDPASLKFTVSTSP